MEFSTQDVDNDELTGSCALVRAYGGNWYRTCTNQHLSGKYGQPGDRTDQFMHWNDGYKNMALHKMRWMLREV